MSKHNETGINGENIAANFLLNNGYTILHRNWCHGKKEIDAIAQKEGLLVFIEIKTRTSFDFGFPEEAVTLKKQNYLKVAAEAFLGNNPQFLKIRFDIISVLLEKGTVKEIVHFEEAFYWHYFKALRLQNDNFTAFYIQILKFQTYCSLRI